MPASYRNLVMYKWACWLGRLRRVVSRGSAGRSPLLPLLSEMAEREGLSNAPGLQPVEHGCLSSARASRMGPATNASMLAGHVHPRAGWQTGTRRVHTYKSCHQCLRACRPRSSACWLAFWRPTSLKTKRTCLATTCHTSRRRSAPSLRARSGAC